MIILHPDGSYEVCELPPRVARWLHGLGRRARERVREAVRRVGDGAEACWKPRDGACPDCGGGAC